MKNRITVDACRKARYIEWCVRFDDLTDHYPTYKQAKEFAMSIIDQYDYVEINRKVHIGTLMHTVRNRPIMEGDVDWEDYKEYDIDILKDVQTGSE